MSTNFLEGFIQGKEPEMADTETAPCEPQAGLEEQPPEDTLEDQIIAAIRTVYDPEIPVNVYDLGLIYKLEVDDAGFVLIHMTLTSPMCPVAEILPAQVEQMVRMVNGIADVDLELVWDPPWHPGRLSEETKLELGLL